MLFPYTLHKEITETFDYRISLSIFMDGHIKFLLLSIYFFVYYSPLQRLVEKKMLKVISATKLCRKVVVDV